MLKVVSQANISNSAFLKRLPVNNKSKEYQRPMLPVKVNKHLFGIKRSSNLLKIVNQFSVIEVFQRVTRKATATTMDKENTES